MTPTVGRLVNFVLPDGPSKGEARPAVIVRVWNATCLNLQVLADGSNDGPRYANGPVWETSVCEASPESKTERSWHWPVREGEQLPVLEATPAIGEPVHYQAYGTPGGEYLPAPRAATITQVNEDGTVGLAVLNPTGLFFNASVPFAAEPKPGHWNWIR